MALVISSYTGRWGGEEFLIFVPEATGESQLQLAEKIRKAVELSSFPAQTSAGNTSTRGCCVIGQENLDDIESGYCRIMEKTGAIGICLRRARKE